MSDITCILSPQDREDARQGPDWGDEIPFDGGLVPTELSVPDVDGQPICQGALVQSPKTGRDYWVLRIRANGRLSLWNQGHRIPNADPQRWRLVWNAEPEYSFGET